MVTRVVHFEIVEDGLGMAYRMKLSGLKHLFKVINYVVNKVIQLASLK